MRTRQASAYLLVAIALAAGCGCTARGGDDRTAAQRRADTAAARRMLLTGVDLPAGYRAGPADADDDGAGERVEAALARCLHVSKGFVDPDNAKATSPTFSTADDGTEITSEVTVTPSPAVAGRKLDLFQAEAAPGCYETAFRREFARQASGLPFVELGDTSVERVDVADLGDETVAYRVNQRLSERGQKVSLYVAVLLVRVGRIGITTTFATQGEPFDRGEAADLTRVVADRARAA